MNKYLGSAPIWFALVFNKFLALFSRIFRPISGYFRKIIGKISQNSLKNEVNQNSKFNLSKYHQNLVIIFILYSVIFLSSCGKEGALYLPSQDNNKAVTNQNVL